MFAKEETLVGGVDNDCVVQLTNFFEIIQQAADIFVYCQNCCQIITHILLIFPAD